MTKPRSLVEHAAHLKHYREHFTVIFGQSALPGQPTLLSSSAGNAQGELQLPAPAGPAAGRTEPGVAGTAVASAPVYQVRARLKTSQAVVSQMGISQEAVSQAAVSQAAVFQPGAVAVQAPRDTQPDRAWEAGPDMRPAPAEPVGSGPVLGDVGTDARQSEGDASENIRSGASLAGMPGPAEAQAFPDVFIPEQRRWQSPPLPSPELQERISVPETGPQSAQPLAGSQSAPRPQVPGSRSEATEDGALARNTSTGQLGFRDLLGFANVAAQPDPARVQPETLQGSARRQPFGGGEDMGGTDVGGTDTDAVSPSALLAAAGRGSAGQAGAGQAGADQAGAANTSVPTIPGVAVNTPATRGAAEPVFPEFPEPVFSEPVFSAPGAVTELVDFDQERSALNPAASLPTTAQLTAPLPNEVYQEREPAEPRAARMDSAVEGGPTGSTGQGPETQNQRPAEADSGLYASAEANRGSVSPGEPEQIRESGLVTESGPVTGGALPPAGLTPTSAMTQDQPGNEASRQPVPGPQQSSLEPSGLAEGRPEQAVTSPSSVIQPRPDAADLEPGTAVSSLPVAPLPVAGMENGSGAAAQTMNAAPEDTAGALRPVQPGDSDSAPNSAGSASPVSNSPGSASPVLSTSGPTNLESAGADFLAPAAPVKFTPPGEDLETLRRLREHLPSTDPGVGFSLPRRPRPVPIKAPKVAEVVPEAPVHTQEQALSFLDRLQRLAEREADGSSELRSLSVAELLTWDKSPPSASPSALGRAPASPDGTVPSGEAAPGLPQGPSLSAPYTASPEETISSEKTVLAENVAAPITTQSVGPSADVQATVLPTSAPVPAAADRRAPIQAPESAETAVAEQAGPPLPPAVRVPQVEAASATSSPPSAAQTAFTQPASTAPLASIQPPLPGEPTSFPATAPAGRPVLRARLSPAPQVSPVPPAIQNDLTVDSGMAPATMAPATPDVENVPVTTMPGTLPAAPGPSELLASQSALREESGTNEEPEDEAPSVLAEVGPDRTEAVQTTAGGAAAQKTPSRIGDARTASGGLPDPDPPDLDPPGAAPSSSVSRPPGQKVATGGPSLPDDRSAQPPVEPAAPSGNTLPGETALAPEREAPQATTSEATRVPEGFETSPQATEQAADRQTARPGSGGPLDAAVVQESSPIREPLSPFPTRDQTFQNPATFQDRPIPVMEAAVARTQTTNLFPVASIPLNQPNLSQADAPLADSELLTAALLSSGLSRPDQPSSDQTGPNQTAPDQSSSPGSGPDPSDIGQRVPEQAGSAPASRMSEPTSEAALLNAPAFAETSTASPGQGTPGGRKSAGEDPKGVGDAQAVAADLVTKQSLTSETLPPATSPGSAASGSAAGAEAADGSPDRNPVRSMVPLYAAPEKMTREAPLDAAPETARMPQGPTRLPPPKRQTDLQAAPEPVENRPVENNPSSAPFPGDRPGSVGPVPGDPEPGRAVQSVQPLGAQATDMRSADMQSVDTQSAAVQATDGQTSDSQPLNSQGSATQARTPQLPGIQSPLTGVDPALPFSVQLPTVLPLSAQSLSAQPASIQPPPQPRTRQEQTLQAALADPGSREPLPLSVRARLAPLLGRELGETQLLRNAAAAAVTSSASADALAVGDTVLLSPGQDLSSPRGLGLLAHELTHVLRQRDPGFVPAVVRSARVTAGSSTGRNDPAGVPASATPDEEGLAEHVEGLVREQFERRGRQQAAGTGFAVPAASAPSAEEQPWGGLPAPWEAMPFWDAQGAPPTPSARPPRPSVSAQTRSGAGSSGSRAPASQGSASTGAAPLAQAASTTRSVPSSSADEAARPALPAVGSDKNKARNAPDLDRLAQQVYSLIKGRLHTEIRRNR